MIQKIKYRFEVLQSLKECYLGVEHLFFVNLIVSLIYIGLNFINPIFYKIFIDDVILCRNTNKIVIVIAGYLGVFILSTVIEFIKIYCNNKITNRCVFRLRMKIWKNMFEKSFAEYEHINFNDIKITIEKDVQVVESFAEGQSVKYIIDILSAIVSGGILFLIDYRLAIVAIVVIPLTFLLDHIVSKKEQLLLEENRVLQEEQSRWLCETIQGWREIKALNLVEVEKSKFREFINRFDFFFSRWNLYATTRKLVIPKIKDEFVMQFIIYFMGGIFILHHQMSIGLLLVFMQYYNYFSNSIKDISQADADLVSDKVQSERALIAARRNSTVQIIGGEKINKIEQIEMKDIKFSYNISTGWSIDQFSMKIKSGEKVALIGKSGIGKSTIIKLLLGLLEPQEGSILYNNILIHDIYMKGLYQKIGIIMQDNLLFNGTIMENLILGKPKATEKECIDACKMANIYEFIVNLPEKFNTIIGDRGIRLSGGQKQRLILARVFLVDVDVYIFDEATSALDQYSENLIFDAINNIKNDKIVLVVAHRKSSIDLCDRVINMSKEEKDIY